MRLINARTISLEDFSLRTIPPYAIISHTWTRDEVSFQDMSLPSRFSKKGYEKIQRTCELALQHGYEYAWVDTCCIDKSSSAELTESINSMFRWYRDAAVCFAFLEDLPPKSDAWEDDMKVAMGRCPWFTRGWTLQELLAPRILEFFDATWTFRGAKASIIGIICDITNIPGKVVHGIVPIGECSIAMKMSWAAHRHTTRVEDIAYCLLGLFEVNMPLIYGEGLNAFRRLQEEIVRRKNDLTIFVWSPSPTQSHTQGIPNLPIFASSPAEFGSSGDIIPFGDDAQNFSITNKGLLMSGDAPMRVARLTMEDGRKSLQYLIYSGLSWPDIMEGTRVEVGIYLRKIGPKLFCRDQRFPLAGLGGHAVDQVDLFDVTDYYILADPISPIKYFASTRAFRRSALHVPVDKIFTLMDVVPESLWDVSDRILLRPKPYKWARYHMVLAMRFQGVLAGVPLNLFVLCDYRNDEPICKVFPQGEYRRQVAKLFDGRYREESLPWTDLEVDGDEIFSLKQHADISVKDLRFHVAVSCEKGSVHASSSIIEAFVLKFEVSIFG